MLETFLLEDSRVHVIFKMAIIDRKANAIHSERCVKLGIIFAKEILQELYTMKAASTILL
jgi:hypothetical protein